MDEAAPLLCAGVTVYSPMKFYGTTPTMKRCGVVGLGGVGHMAVKFAKALGLHVTVISSSPSKEIEAREVLGADNFLVSTNHQAMKVMLVIIYYTSSINYNFESSRNLIMTFLSGEVLQLTMITITYFEVVCIIVFYTRAIL